MALLIKKMVKDCIIGESMSCRVWKTAPMTKSMYIVCCTMHWKLREQFEKIIWKNRAW